VSASYFVRYDIVTRDSKAFLEYYRVKALPVEG